jgi:hypothetical protein
MTRGYYLKHKEELKNKDWVHFAKMELYLKNAIENAPKNQIEILDAEGRWYSKSESLPFRPALVYRVNPDWAGPAEPPKPTFVDVKPHVDIEGDLMIKNPKHGDYYLHRMVLGDGCIGFSYGGVLYTRLQCEPMYDDVSRVGFKLLTPDFVRFQV